MSKKKVNNAFKNAVEKTPDTSNCFQSGLRALGGHSNKIALSDSCDGSVDIDKCLFEQKKYLNANRWDYAFGYKSQAYFVEVHSANTSEVATVLRKLQWLKDWLKEKAPEINKIKASKPYYWVASGKYNILKTSPQFRTINQAGLNPISALKI